MHGSKYTTEQICQNGLSQENASHHHDSNGHPNAEFVQVIIYATGGIFPEDGAVRIPANQKLRVVLEQAAKALEITDWSSWVATVDGRVLVPERTLKENGLEDDVAIDWGPREGGGG